MQKIASLLNQMKNRGFSFGQTRTLASRSPLAGCKVFESRRMSAFQTDFYQKLEKRCKKLHRFSIYERGSFLYNKEKDLFKGETV